MSKTDETKFDPETQHRYEVACEAANRMLFELYKHSTEARTYCLAAMVLLNDVICAVSSVHGPECAEDLKKETIDALKDLSFGNKPVLVSAEHEQNETGLQ